MDHFTLPSKAARLIVLQRIEIIGFFLKKLRKFFGRYIFSNFIVKYFLNPKSIGEKYHNIMLNGVEHMNFFEGRATEYSKASTQGTWVEAFS